jgi:3-oxoacyl-(acyl-carrier-protein) synthase III
VRDDEPVSDLALEASRRALEAAGRIAADLDLIIVATTTPDMTFPATAAILQRKLGAPVLTAFDVQAVCSGFVYAMSVADGFVARGLSKCALVVGAEAMTRLMDYTDRGTCILFGDGAGAVVLEPVEGQGDHRRSRPAGLLAPRGRDQAGPALCRRRRVDDGHGGQAPHGRQPRVQACGRQHLRSR